jgi:hypothetical protein
MTSSDLPQDMAENTISLLLGHPDPATLLTPEFRQAMQNVISSPQAYTCTGSWGHPFLERKNMGVNGEQRREFSCRR